MSYKTLFFKELITAWAPTGLFGHLAIPLFASFATLAGLTLSPNFALAQETTKPNNIQPTIGDYPPGRYGPLNLFDHRSQYGVGVFPEPFLIDDSDLEVNEIRVDWLHTEVHHTSSDLITGEFEKGFGLTTLEIEVPWARESPDVHGMANIDLGVRTPFYQFVSASGLIDTTFGVALEVGVPTNSQVSKNTEIVPKIFNDTVLGENFTIQTVLGYSALLGGGDDGGVNTFEYGFVFGYAIQHRLIPIPGVAQVVPVAELSGETQLNKDMSGHNSLTGDVGFRFNLKAIGKVQPRLGIVYVFPIDHGARQDVHWGIATSLVFEF